MTDPATFADYREQEREVKKQIILQAAIRVFSQKSLQQASLRDIAEQAGISHATIYRYFQDKQALFVEAFIMGAEELIERLEAVVASSPAESLLEATAETFLDYLNEHEHYFTMMTQFMLEGSLSQDSVARLNQSMKTFLDVIERAIRLAGGQADGRTLAHTFFACLNGILITFHNYPGRSRQELEAHMKTLAHVFIRMFKGDMAADNANRSIPGGAP
jgi:AcrR family transcriptional regulator